MPDEDLSYQYSRRNLYALISRILMQEVDAELLETIENDEIILSFFPNYKAWEKRSMERQSLIERYLNVDFTNLFLLHLIPYESFYVRDDQMIESGGDNSVLDFYNRYDFRVELNKARVVSPDHIGIEFEFMYMLSEARIRALEEGDEEAAEKIAAIEHEFMRDHLIEWAPMYLMNLKAEAGTPFYFDTAGLALEFLLSDYETLCEIQKSV